MFLTKLGDEHTCESAIYTHQHSKMIQQKCDIEYYPNMVPEPELLNAGNYLVLGNFPLPWNYYCLQTDEIPKPIHGSAYVILKKLDMCQCSLTAGSWYLEANIAYCTQEPSSELTLYYTVNMATIMYQFQEKLKTDGITDLTLFTENIGFIATPSFGDELTIPADDPQYNTCIVERANDPSSAASSVGETPSSVNFSDGSKTKDDPKESYLHVIHPSTPGIPSAYISRNRRMDKRRSMMIKKTQRTLMNQKVIV